MGAGAGSGGPIMRGPVLTSRCAGCGWTLTVRHGRAGTRYHPPSCPRCGGRRWDTEGAETPAIYSPGRLLTKANVAGSSSAVLPTDSSGHLGVQTGSPACLRPDRSASQHVLRNDKARSKARRQLLSNDDISGRACGCSNPRRRAA